MKESNKRGFLTYAKTNAPNTRSTQLFINLKDNPNLDAQGFAPFGRIIEGMDVVDSFYAAYGDGPPRGEGVYQAMAIAKGAEYLDEFPELDVITGATIVDGG